MELFFNYTYIQTTLNFKPIKTKCSLLNVYKINIISVFNYKMYTPYYKSILSVNYRLPLLSVSSNPFLCCITTISNSIFYSIKMRISSIVSQPVNSQLKIPVHLAQNQLSPIKLYFGEPILSIDRMELNTIRVLRKNYSVDVVRWMFLVGRVTSVVFCLKQLYKRRDEGTERLRVSGMTWPGVYVSQS